PTRIIGTNSIYNLATAADSSGNLYVAYKQFEGEYFALYVQKYINCSGSASLVGSSYIDMTSTASDKIAIAVNNSGEIFIAYLSDNTTLKVKKFTAGAWYDITANIFSYGSVYSNYLDLDVDSQGNPYIAFQDSSKSNKATVKKYVTEEWFTQGTGSDSAVSATSGGEVSFLDLKICGDTIFLAFADSGDANKPNVMQYTQSGWTRVGSSSAYSAAVSSISLTTYYGKPYIAFIDSSASYSATVRHYNGSSWVTLGSAGITNSDLTLPPVLVINTSGIPFLGYRNGASSNLGNVKKYISY
ncbi:hypothetical protein KA977_10485, partial [Candidatus Dependentiae bacterium]|nr:hypothetical protein [Candidatus Dependentiae bacterium]